MPKPKLFQVHTSLRIDKKLSDAINDYLKKWNASRIAKYGAGSKYLLITRAEAIRYFLREGFNHVSTDDQI